MKQWVLNLASYSVLALVLAVGFGPRPVQPGQGQASRAEPTARQEKIQKLLDILRDRELQESDPDKIVNAIVQLRDMKAVEAIDGLIEMLTYRRVWPWEKKLEPGQPPHPHDGFGPTGNTTAAYPATAALTTIGKPALPALLKVIETFEVDSLDAKNARHTVRMIFLMHGGNAESFFKECAAKAATPEAKQRLLHALETADEDWKAF
jgi:hypothetical protein